MESALFKKIQQDPGRLIQHEREIVKVTVYEWERDGVQQVAFNDENPDVPYDAAKIELQLYNYPTGQLRRIYFPKGARTPWHHNYDDIILYGTTAHQVEFVGLQTFHSRPGDATLHPAGVAHHSETIVEGERLEFAFGDKQGKCGCDLIALRAHGMTLHEITEWVEDGRRRHVIGPTDRRGSSYRARMFYFPVYSMIEAHLPKGQTLPLHTNDSERLFYVLSGRLKVITDAEQAEVGPGAMVRMVAGRPFAREALEASVILDLEASTAPRTY